MMTHYHTANEGLRAAKARQNAEIAEEEAGRPESRLAAEARSAAECDAGGSRIPQTRPPTLAEQVASLQAQLESLESDFEDALGRVAALEAEVGGLEARVADLELRQDMEDRR